MIFISLKESYFSFFFCLLLLLFLQLAFIFLLLYAEMETSDCVLCASASVSVLWDECKRYA